MAVYQTDSFSGITKILMPIIKDALAEVGDKVNELMQNRVDVDVYMAGRQTNYYANGTMQPTFGLRDSITTSQVKSSGNTAEVTVYHDSDKMQFDPDSFIHGSRYWKDGTTDIRDILPEIVAFGLSGDLFGSGWWQDERPYYQNTLKELKEQGKLRQWFIEALKKRGINAI
jgi:hypothetical protein